MTTIAAPKMPTLYAKQRAAIFAPARYAVIEASTKSGKTAGCLIWLFVLAWNDGKPGRNYWWLAPIHPQSKVAYARLKRMLARSDPRRRVWQSNESECWVQLANGARLWFKSGDNADGLYGEDVYGAVVDEATRCKEEAFHALRSTLTATRGPVRIIGNVRGRRNWAYALARRAEAGEAGMSYHKLTAWDAVEGGILDAAEIEDARRTLPEHVYRQLYLAEPADDGGNPFGLDAIRACCLSGLSALPAVAFGVDLAKSVDFTVVCGLDELGQVCVLERWRSDWAATFEKVLRLIGDVPALVDSTGVGDPLVEQMGRQRSTVAGFHFSSSSKQQLFEGLAAAIQKREVFFPEGWLTAELEDFEYEYRGGSVRYSAPPGLTDDGACALALAWRQLTEGRHGGIGYAVGFFGSV